MSADTTDVLSADTTDVLLADTIDVLSADTTGLSSANTSNPSNARVLPLENSPAPNSATGKPLNAGFWLWKNLSHRLRFGGRGLGGLGLGGRGLGHPCESPLGNLATVRVAHPGLVPDFGAKKGPIFRSWA